MSAKEFQEADLKTVDIFASETVLASVAKQTSPKDGKDCRADKSARKDVVNHQLNTLATRKFAFTLAEVLITLVIIGIIAAVTVPTLMANYKKQEVSSRLKKFYSTLSQAVRLADIENPDFLRSTYSSRTSQNYGNWWNDNLGKYMPVEEKDNTTYKFFSGSSGTITPSKLYILNDGSMFSLGWSGYYNSTEILYDINGEKAPNTGGKDVFRFEINDLRRSFNVNSTRKKLWICGGSYCGGSANREAVIKGCSANSPRDCSKLLELDGWEIKDDYPLL